MDNGSETATRIEIAHIKFGGGTRPSGRAGGRGINAQIAETGVIIRIRCASASIIRWHLKSCRVAVSSGGNGKSFTVTFEAGYSIVLAAGVIPFPEPVIQENGVGRIIRGVPIPLGDYEHPTR